MTKVLFCFLLNTIVLEIFGGEKISHFKNIKNIIILNIPNLISGGPEALCQLFYELQNSPYHVRMLWDSASLRKVQGADHTWYLCKQPEQEGTPAYKTKYLVKNLEYNVPLDDSTLIILPEVCPHLIRFFEDAYIGFYWLSINNFYYKDSQHNRSLLFDPKYNSGKLIHLSDAPYISKKLQDWGYTSYLLEAPISHLYFSIPQTKNKIENSIVYNPAKWEHLANAFMNSYPDHTFMPLRGLNQQGMIDALDEAKIYIDFGYFPGKDRIPREALARNCIIFIHNHGCATDFDSFPVDDYFRFSEEEITNGVLHDKVLYTLTHYEEMYYNQAYARNIVHHELINFQQQIEKLFS